MIGEAVLPREFYARPTVDVARGLLGKVLVHGTRAGRIVETEAYLGTGDPAAHSAAGLTPRTRVIFGPPGHAYVYLSYGIHHCLNIVAEPDGTAGCVLIRALEPVSVLPLAPNGPGKLTRAMGIDLSLYGADLTTGPLTVLASPDLSPNEIAITARIGITKAADLPLRFFLAGNPSVSGLRRSGS
ncbi:MAG: DNA-3-methyladenine glycosylase [Bryobacteraceae bacterium]